MTLKRIEIIPQPDMSLRACVACVDVDEKTHIWRERAVYANVKKINKANGTIVYEVVDEDNPNKT
jgi:hypothetical protein